MSIELNKNNFEDQISHGTTLVDFWAAWCGPCRAQGTILAKLEQEPDFGAKIAKVNVDLEQELAVKFEIASIPTLIVFKDGKAVKRVSGVQSMDALKQMIK